MDFIGPEEILRKKREYLIPCVYNFYQEPMQLVKGEGVFLTDHKGKEYIDFFAGVSVLNAGHCHPEITKAICNQLKTLQHTTTIYLTQPIVDLAEKLAEVTPGNLKKSFFCSSGSEANEGALLLAKLFTGQNEFIALRNGLHGRTHLTMSATGLSFWRTDPAPAAGIQFIPNPYCYRCAFNATYPTCDLACAKELETVIETATAGKPAAFLAEPIQGNGGIITPPKEYFQEIKRILDKYDSLLIIDEVQTGFGRTGKMFAIENYDVTPDIMTIAKALANGTPVGAFIATPQVADCYTRPGASTLGGNPVTAVAAMATLDVIKKEKLIEKAADTGKYFKEKLESLQEKHSMIGDVRGIGLMLGAEIVNEDKEPASEVVDKILEYLKDKGLLIGKNGRARNVLAFQPPLIIGKDHIDELIRTLDEAFIKIGG